MKINKEYKDLYQFLQISQKDWNDEQICEHLHEILSLENVHFFYYNDI